MKTNLFVSRRAFCGGLIGLASAAAGIARAAATTGDVRSSSIAPMPVLLAKELDPGADPAGYLVSEKYDGARALWDGKRLRFRSGREVHAPAWFVERLPAQALDGELWLARGQFEALSGTVRRLVPDDDAWRHVRYQIFELPGAPGTFNERAARIREIVAASAWPALRAVEQEIIDGRAALQARLDQVVRGGGEGLVLHRADAPYVTGRSDVLLKLKPLQDSEAEVIAHVPGKGKYAGQLGALKLRTAEGAVVMVGTGFTDADRSAPPPLGSFVTYTHRGWTRDGVPRFASFMRVHTAF